MKKISLCFLLGCCLLGSTGLVQAAPKNSLTVQPLGIYGGIANVELEHIFEHQAAWAVRANYVSTWVDDWSVYGMGGGASYRFFPISSMRAPRGLWLGPAVDFIYTNGTYNNVLRSTLLVGAGAEIGWKFLFGHQVAFVVSPFASVHYWFGNLTVQDHILPYYNGAGVSLGVSLGIAF